MVTKIWRGDAPAVAQVTHVTPANVQVGDTFRLTVNGKTISVVATAATPANVCTLLVAAIEDSDILEFGEFRASVSGGVLVLTAATAGVPFTVTADSADGSALAVTVTTTTQGAAASGATNMTQTFRVPLSAAGSILIVFGGELATTAVGASAATLQADLEALSSIGVGNVSVTKSTDSNDSIYTLEFLGAFAGIDVAEVIAVVQSTKPLIRTTQEGSASGTPQNEKQTIGLGDAYSGGGSFGYTYTLTHDGQTTPAIDGNASAATVQAQLISLSSIDADGVSVTTLADGDTLQVEFVGTEGSAPHAQITASVYSGSASRITTLEVVTVPSSGSGAAVDEVQVITIAGSPTGGTFTLTYDGQTTGTIAYNASAATVDAALEALSNIGAGDVAVTGDAGGPWTVTFQNALAGTNVAQMTGSAAGLTGGDADTLTVSEITASAGPNHWDTAANWIPSGVPITGDDVRFEIGRSDCLYGLDQTGITLASLHISMTWTGKLGLPRQNPDGYVEYRTQELTCGITELLVGYGDGSGPGKVAINTLAVQTTVEVRGSGSSSDAGIPPVTWRGTHADNVVTVLDGDFGTAPYADQTAVIDVFLQRGGSVALRNTSVTTEAVYPRQTLSTYNCTLGGQKWEA